MWALMRNVSETIWWMMEDGQFHRGCKGIPHEVRRFPTEGAAERARLAWMRGRMTDALDFMPAVTEWMGSDGECRG